MASAGGSSGSLLGGAAMLAPSILGAVSGSVGAANNAAAQSALLNYQEQNALTNAKLSDQQAADTIQQGELQASQLSQRASQLKGSQRAAIGASGVRLDSGSAVNLQQSTDYMRDVDMATIRNNAARAAWGQQVTASNYRGRAAALAAGANAQSPTASGVSSLLGSASGVAGQWYKIYQSGGFGSGSSSPYGNTYNGFDNPQNYG